jgi:TM2 domain-containing membrane protein YozV
VRAQAAAVLLALFGGIIGRHHFYVGQTRKGICYAASFWLAIPMILGWLDAVRLALLTEPQFQARIIHAASKRAAVK